MAPEDFGDDAVEVWPENWPVVQLFIRVATQWRHGFHGPTGLDYTPMLRLMDRMGLDDSEYDQMIDDIRTLEAAALEEFARQRDD